jgi:hypothetical protein
MTRNVAILERAARVVLGGGLLALTFVGPRTYWGLLGLVLIVTGLIGFCPIYRLFGISTSRVAAGQQR